jgi:hypothetical protein
MDQRIIDEFCTLRVSSEPIRYELTSYRVAERPSARLAKTLERTPFGHDLNSVLSTITTSRTIRERAMSLSALIGGPVDYIIGTKTIKVKPFTINEIAKLQEWVNRTYRNPLLDMLPSLGQVDPETRHAIILQAKTWTAPQFGTPEAEAILSTIGGMREIFRILVTTGDPTKTEKDADAIAGEISIDEFVGAISELMVIAFGKSEGFDPKKDQESPSTGKE